MKDSKELVSSKIEITKNTGERERKGDSLREYHANVRSMGKKIVEFALDLSPNNLLTVKMAIMGAMREVERRMRENERG